MGFLKGFLGVEFGKKRLSPQGLVEKEEDRDFSKQVRTLIEEAREKENFIDFLKRQPYSQVSLVRPSNFNEYIGQENVKDMVLNLIQASKIKNAPFPHTLFWGEAGLGKTTLSYLIAKELKANLIITSGGQLENKDELLNIFKQFGDTHRNILYIDEIHAVRRRIAEMLYSAMEDYRFDYTTGTNKVFNLNLPPFTLLGATTDLARLLVPMRQRFQNRFQLVPYEIKELSLIIQNYLKRISYPSVDPKVIEGIALRSRNVARYSINFTRNIADYALVQRKQLTTPFIEDYFNKEGIDKNGLTNYDRDYLKLLYNSKNMKAGINTITKSIGVDRLTAEREIEPFLLRKGYIAISTGGRELTKTGIEAVS